MTVELDERESQMLICALAALANNRPELAMLAGILAKRLDGFEHFYLYRGGFINLRLEDFLTDDYVKPPSPTSHTPGSRAE